MKKTGIHILGNNHGDEKAAYTITYDIKNVTSDDQYECMEEGYIAKLLHQNYDQVQMTRIIKRVNDIIARAGLKVIDIEGDHYDCCEVKFTVKIIFR
ncbi:predicted protein [Chaetoceros tenuissimus]|nr:predicted protein [Chaetoceros tenuissimus]